MIAVFEVDFCKPIQASSTVFEFIHIREEVSIGNCDFVDSAVIDASTQATAMMFGDEEHWRGAGGFGFCNSSHLSHLFKPISEFFEFYFI